MNKIVQTCKDFLFLVVIVLPSIKEATSCILTSQCDCHYNGAWTVDCNEKFLTSVPQFRPANSTVGKIILTGNLIQVLPSHAFRNLNRTKIIVLEHNRLTFITSKAFLDVIMLEELHLNWNSITIVPTEALSALKHLKKLKLAHNRLVSIEENSFQGLNSLETLDLSGNQLISIADQAFLGLGAMKTLQLNNNLLSYLSDNSFVGLEGMLFHINLSNNVLTKLNDRALSRLKKLTTFLARNNKLASLQRNTFKEMTSLSKLDLSFNELNYNNISRGAFSGASFFIQKLNLSYNDLETFPATHLADFINLNELCLSNNKLVSLPNCIDISCIFLRVKPRLLDLSHNNIDRIPATAFNGLRESLLHLNLASNQLEQVPFLDNLAAMKEFYLQDNRITDVDNTIFVHARNLEKLRLDGNGLKHLSPDVFKGSPRLYFLSLRRNNFTTVPTLGNMPGLVTLYLSENYIESLEGHAFTGLPQLIDVHLSHNRITVINRDAFSGVNHITRLYLDNNAINESSFNGFNNLKYLLELRLSGNNISLIPENGLKNLVSLKWLFIRNNYISNIGPKALTGLRSLSTIDISNNNLHNLNECTFTNLSNLNTVTLTGNRLHCTCQMVWMSNQQLPHWIGYCSSPPRLKGTSLQNIFLGSCTDDFNSTNCGAKTLIGTNTVATVSTETSTKAIHATTKTEYPITTTTTPTTDRNNNSNNTTRHIYNSNPTSTTSTTAMHRKSTSDEAYQSTTHHSNIGEGASTRMDSSFNYTEIIISASICVTVIFLIMILAFACYRKSRQKIRERQASTNSLAILPQRFHSAGSVHCLSNSFSYRPNVNYLRPSVLPGYEIPIEMEHNRIYETIPYVPVQDVTTRHATQNIYRGNSLFDNVQQQQDTDYAELTGESNPTLDDTGIIENLLHKNNDDQPLYAVLEDKNVLRDMLSKKLSKISNQERVLSRIGSTRSPVTECKDLVDSHYEQAANNGTNHDNMAHKPDYLELI